MKRKVQRRRDQTEREEARIKKEKFGKGEEKSGKGFVTQRNELISGRGPPELIQHFRF